MGFLPLKVQKPFKGDVDFVFPVSLSETGEKLRLVIVNEDESERFLVLELMHCYWCNKPD